jgi:hypothetical protein
MPKSAIESRGAIAPTAAQKKAYDLLFSRLKTKYRKFIQVTDNPDIEHA